MPRALTSSSKPPPKQARATAKRDAILKTAEELLDQYAPADITTRLVAEAANVPIGSIYRYFSNVDALLVALFSRMNAGTIQALRENVLGDAQDWRAHLNRTFDHLESMHRSHPSYGALMAHVNLGNPEDDEAVRLLTLLLRRNLPDASPTLVHDITQTVIAMVDGVERQLFRLPNAQRDALFQQARIAVTAYLSHYLTAS